MATVVPHQVRRYGALNRKKADTMTDVSIRSGS